MIKPQSESPDFLDRMQLNCYKLYDNMNYLKNLDKRNPIRVRLKNNFLVIRYEDFAINYEKWLPKIYHFAGLPVFDRNYKSILSWIEINTTSDEVRSEFSTTKNATVSVNKFINQLSFSEIKMIQNMCGREIFEFYGYKFYDERTDFDLERSKW